MITSSHPKVTYIDFEHLLLPYLYLPHQIGGCWGEDFNLHANLLNIY